MKSSSSQKFIAGNIQHHLPQWLLLSQDSWIHQAVTGYSIDFDSEPPIQSTGPTYHRTKEEEMALDREIAELITKEAVEEVDFCQARFVSPMFIVPKKGGKWRPVLNLKSLNQYVSKAHFKLEDIRSLKDILHQGNFMAKLDLKEAYLSVPMAYQSRRFLQFRWKDKLLQFTCLPFGLSSAPFVFTKLVRPVLASVRELGIRCLMYIDDMLILGETSEELSHNFQSCQTLMTSLGFVVNNEKSIAGPTQEIEFLGFVINSRSMTLAVTKEKLKSLTSQCKNLLQSQRTTVHHLAQVIGTMTSLNQAVLPAPLHYRGLQELRNESLDLHHSYDFQILLSQRVMTDLKWWIDHGSQWRAGQILISQPALTIESDASDLGWGATCLSSKDVTGGVWSSQERLLHINCKELLAAWLGLQCYAKNMRNCHVHLKIDNTAAVAYINKMGGVPSRDLCQLALRMWNWCIDRHITISAEHLPGSQNQVADKESRSKADSSEWALDSHIFEQLMDKRGPCTVDLFASRLSAKLPTYYSWRSDPEATAVNALCQPWGTSIGYAFPPFCLIGRCLAKITSENVPRIILITPLWKSQAWFPLILRMSVEIPLLLPSHKKILTDPRGKSHPMVLQGHLQLVAWTVSGVHSKIEDFQRMLSSSSVLHGEVIPKHHTLVTGECGLTGAQNKVLIPLTRM